MQTLLSMKDKRGAHAQQQAEVPGFASAEVLGKAAAALESKEEPGPSPKLQKRSHPPSRIGSSQVLDKLAEARSETETGKSEIKSLFDFDMPEVAFGTPMQKDACGPASPTRSFEEDAEAPKSPSSSSAASLRGVPAAAASVKDLFYGVPVAAKAPPAATPMMATAHSEWHGEYDVDVQSPAKQGLFAGLHDFDEF